MARPRKYTLNENYFDVINNCNKAYLIGFIYADGSINLQRSSLTICISKSDIEILEFIKIELEYSGEIKTKIINNSEYSLLNITSKKLITQLNDLGVIQNKTYDSKTFPFVPENYFNDMLRGFFDGDGSIYKTGEKGFGVSFSSNIFILKIIQDYFSTLQIKTSKIRLRNKNSIHSGMLELKGNNQILKLKSLLYYDSSIFYLKRKLDKFKEFEQYISKLKRRNLSEETVLEIKNLFLNGKTQKEIHLFTGLTFSSVRTVIQRLRKNGEI